MRLDVVLAILAMALVTYACRAGGFAVLRVMRPPPFLDAMLRNLPGPLFAAYVALAICGWASSGQGVQAAIGCVMVVLVQWRSGNLTFSILAGIGSVALTAWLLG